MIDLFAGLPVSDYQRALTWYERLLGSGPAFFPNATEAVWELAPHRMLRFVLFRSAGDVVLRDLLAADALVYAGYSAGACVLSSTLRGLEVVDDAGAVMRIYGSEPVWDGLALLKEAFVPHYQSPGHPETAAIDLVAARYQAEGVGYRPLRDGQTLLISGADTEIV